MQKRNFIIFFIIVSFCLHVLFALYFSIKIKDKGNPSVYGWLNVVSKNDLFLKDNDFNFPVSVNFSSESIRKKYFPRLTSTPLFLLKDNNDSSLSSDELKNAKLFSEYYDSYLYLWDRSMVFPTLEEETVPYRAYISSYGKVLFLYPEKLPVNSYGNIQLQKYIREATFFFDDKFFWTKLEGVVK